MSYFVSIHEDMRDAMEIFSASGPQHAAELAINMGLPRPSWSDDVYVKDPRGQIHELEIFDDEEAEIHL